MDDVNVLVTGAGAPGIMGTMYSLRNNFDGRRIRIIGTDINPEAIGRYLVDEFEVIQRPSSKEYLPRLLEICSREAVRVLIPQNTAELTVLARNKEAFEGIGTTVCVSGVVPLSIANDKNELMSKAGSFGLPVCRHQVVNDFEGLRAAARDIGYPDRKVIVKPPVSNGMRGFRIISEDIDRKKAFYDEKPNNTVMGLDELHTVLGDRFPDLMVGEYLPGEEYSVDILEGSERVIVPRVRDEIKNGITFRGRVVREEGIIEQCNKLLDNLKMRFAIGLQFKLNEEGVPIILESNPRVQGTMVMSTLAGANIIYGAVKEALGERLPRFDVRWGTEFIRYWGGIAVKDGSMSERI